MDYPEYDIEMHDASDAEATGIDGAAAPGSLEARLTRQLEAADELALRLVERAGSRIDEAELSRRHLSAYLEEQHMSGALGAANSAARMMTIFQRGLLTLDRVRNGNR